MSTALLLPPTAPKRPAGVVFIGLNVVRFISLVSLILVVAATITHMVGDFQAVRRASTRWDWLPADNTPFA